jgi:hypothetical protein
MNEVFSAIIIPIIICCCFEKIVEVDVVELFGLITAGEMMD